MPRPLGLASIAIALSILTVPAVRASPAETPKVSALAAQFDANAARAEVRAVMQKDRIPGVQLVLIAKDGEIWRMVDGLADRERNRPMTAETRLQIGSVTKTFTGSLIADLVAQKRLAWTDTLGKIFPELKMAPEIAAISIADLASHTSRLPKDPPNRVDVDGTWRPYTRAELYAALTDPALKLVEPDWNYSNFGFAILGHVVERVTGQHYERVLRDRILEPLGMTHSSVTITSDEESALAVHYWPEDDPLKPRPRWHFGEIAGFGGITSTADDLARFVAYQLDPKAYPNVLDAKATLGMRTVRIMFPNWKIGVGRPWLERREDDGTLVIEHGGEVDGHSAMIMFAPAEGVGVAVTANLGQRAAEDVARPVFERALKLARAQPKPKD